ncbi:rhomboid family intramembrane serine protease [Mangrovimonas aestuarii]|uniref:rhomboid family intramembrane serine protease n=1 Tax=Mangrovimonas aestuarii TaxID=3018443 RepID=UPI0023793F53|nr:rhomboid family intramembrane serine protease [Mangrovimonas aestuarii]
MIRQQHFKFSTGVIAYPLAFILLIWLVFWFELRFGVNLNKFGVYPRTLKGLVGIVCSPFVHGDIEHLYHNSIPLLVLSMALFYFYRPLAWKVLGYGILISGILTWIIGRPSYHIGASGLIYVLTSFLFFKGVFAKHFRLIALSLLVVFLYGNMVWYTMPIEEGMSWEGHLSGLITGLLFALIFKRKVAKPKKYDWEQEGYNEEEDEFLRHFDENGNFVETVENEEEESQDSSYPVVVHYIFKENKKL